MVTFITDLGTFGNLTLETAFTVGGQAQVQLTSAATIGTATVAATANAASSTINISFVPGPPASISLSATPSNLLADGTSTALLQALVVDAQGHPVADGTSVQWTTTLGILNSTSSDTSNGITTATLLSQDVGQATASATIGSVSDTIVVTFEAWVTIDKHIDRVDAPAGGILTYAITVRNNSLGGDPAAINSLSDTLPPGFIYLSGSTLSPAFASDPNIAGQTLTWYPSPTPYVLSGGTVLVTTFQVRATAAAGTYQNVATIQGNNFAPASTGPIAQVTLHNPVANGMTPDNECNDISVSVMIVGNYFAENATASLGPWDLGAVYIDENTLSATVPQYISIGTYDLTVTNPGGASATLANAYTARDCSSPETTLESGFLSTYGREPVTAPENGDDDQIQVLFIDVPAGSGSLYIRIYDPECGGAYDEINGDPVCDTPFAFEIYGGDGTFTDPDARTHLPTSGATSGMQLDSVTFSSDPIWDEQWYSFGPFSYDQGELVNGRRIFKLAVRAGPEPPFALGSNQTDLNLYNVAVSNVDTINDPPAGARIFAYSWTYLIPASESNDPTQVFPFVGAGVTTLVQHNWDFDRSGAAGINILTPQRSFSDGDAVISANDQEQSSAYGVAAGEQGTTWAIQCWSDPTPLVTENVVTVWMTDQGGQELALFARSTNQPPP
jgi:uncharacterized repeat protein (TIGR01451 family)